MPGRALALSFRQLAVLASVGVAWSRALEILSEQADDARLRWMWAVVHDEVTEHGLSLSQALGRYPATFTPFLRALVRQGETTGKLDRTLEEAASSLERQYRLEQRLRATLTYPAFVVVVALGVGLTCLAGLQPFLREFLTDPAELGGARRWLLQLVVFASTHCGTLLSLALALLGAAYWQRVRLAARWKPYWEARLPELPVFGPLVRELAMSRVARTVATGQAAGLSWLRVLELASEITHVKPVEASLVQLRNALRAGQRLETSLLRQEDRTSKLFATMLAVGQLTGDVPRLATWLADLLESQAEHRLESVVALVQPLVLLAVGVLVALMAMLLLVPLGRWL